MEKNKNDIQLNNDEINMDSGVDTSSPSIDENMLDSFGNEEQEEMDLTTDKIKELNKKLPAWSLEPPHSFVK